jgi:hypothetical protein
VMDRNLRNENLTMNNFNMNSQRLSIVFTFCSIDVQKISAQTEMIGSAEQSKISYIFIAAFYCPF